MGHTQDMWMRVVGRWVLGTFLVAAGVSHFTWLRSEFPAQVPDWLPLGDDVVVLVSGAVEIAVGLCLLLLPRHRVLMGWIVAGLFVAVFPGNVNQWVTGSDAFGLDTDRARLIRLLFQPLLIVWALWCTGTWTAFRHRDTRLQR